MKRKLDLISTRINLAREGKNPTVICRMDSGWAVLGDWQYLPGYTLLLADPLVESLNAVSMEESLRFMKDMRIIGDALLKVTDAIRINYQILGNKDEYLHAHITPRYAWEDDTLRVGSPRHYDKSTEPRFDPVKHGTLQEEIRKALGR